MSDLGEARGRIVISTEDLPRAAREVQSASRIMEQSLRAVGIGLGIAEFGRFVVAADQVATAYRRQSVAARQLAGSQEQLNRLLSVYDQATGGALDRATQLANVTQLLSVGFADSTAELDRFARAIRGISIATNRPQDFVTQNLILELFSQRGQRLDQLGLDYQLVRQRADELRAADRSLTQEMAYQQAVLDQALERFGKLNDSVEGQATGLEKLQKAWKNFRLQFGEGASSGGNVIFEQWADDIDVMSRQLRGFLNLLEQLDRRGKQFRFHLGIDSENPDTADFIARATRNPFVDDSQIGLGGRPASRFTDEQTAVITDWFRQTEEIERRANQDRIEATRQYEQQRSDTIRRYEQTIAREAQDFATSRARAEEDYAISLQRMRRDIAQREAKQLEDLERTIATARSDAAERASERQAELQEHIAETRAQSQERIAELEEEFNTRRERAARDHAENLLEAAGRLDAAAVAREQREFAKQQRDADEDFNKRVAKEKRNEEKRLEELEKANAKQVEAEEKALNKRIEQAQDAYQRQLEDARAADEQRLTDMAADFTLRQQRENEDRAIRLQRLKEDHDAQLTEQARLYLATIVQINQREADELQAVNDAFDDRMAALNIYHGDYLEKQNAFQTASLIAYQEYLDAQEAELRRRTAARGPAPLNSFIAPPGQFPSLGVSSLTAPSVAPSGVTNTGSSRVTHMGGVTIAPSIVINGTVGLDSTQIDAAVRSGIVKALEEISN